MHLLDLEGTIIQRRAFGANCKAESSVKAEGRPIAILLPAKLSGVG